MVNPSAARSLGKYEILEELGRGGFATVYRARDLTLERDLALKVLHPQLLTDPSFVERFQREARTLAGLRHPHIVTIYEVGEVAGQLFIAMELARGPSLAQALGDRERIPWQEMLEMLKPVCDALDYAHEQGVTHRDLKPANILLDEERGPLLTDFGFARLMASHSASLSLSGGVVGTPSYIAPEVWEADAAGPPVDIYALGCIVHEMLIGQALFPGNTPMQVMRAHDKGPQFPARWPEGVPEGITDALRKALAREPEARYPGAGAFWYGLNDLAAVTQAEQQDAEQAALAAQWKAETETAMAGGEWSAARMAVGRWLAVVPDDARGRAAQVEVERRLTRTPASAPPPEATPQRATGGIPWGWGCAGVAVIAVVGLAVLLQRPQMEWPSSELTPAASETFLASGLTPVSTPSPESEGLTGEVSTPVAVEQPTPTVISTPIPQTVIKGSPFSSLVLARGIDENSQPVSPGRQFPTGDRPVYLFFDYENIEPGTEWGHVWVKGGEEMGRTMTTWLAEWGTVGTGWVYYAPGDDYGPGSYEVRLLVDGEVVASVDFIVQ